MSFVTPVKTPFDTDSFSTPGPNDTFVGIKHNRTKSRSGNYIDLQHLAAINSFQTPKNQQQSSNIINETPSTRIKQFQNGDLNDRNPEEVELKKKFFPSINRSPIEKQTIVSPFKASPTTSKDTFFKQQLRLQKDRKNDKSLLSTSSPIYAEFSNDVNRYLNPNLVFKNSQNMIPQEINKTPFEISNNLQNTYFNNAQKNVEQECEISSTSSNLASNDKSYLNQKTTFEPLLDENVQLAMTRIANKELYVKTFVFNVFLLFVFKLLVSLIKYIYINTSLLDYLNDTIFSVSVCRFIRLIFYSVISFNLALCLFQIFKKQDQCLDLPLSNAQRELLGLDLKVENKAIEKKEETVSPVLKDKVDLNDIDKIPMIKENFKFKDNSADPAKSSSFVSSFSNMNIGGSPKNITPSRRNF
ncbi:hypothetical protein PACTADRAFT_2804 [Pachysolen tannophilus NRRL Y-2460]|uniref:Nucleoporin POM34 n=1 Tax=Pachysolen tannophilus NRRL Y-2460 TaxID=669874 RepID=A0A1E4TXJ9_PACTA|nr:hypothetical protein PACTADRAFT_2804 [Pachysolen tannophilus NRRL Y-2460]